MKDSKLERDSIVIYAKQVERELQENLPQMKQEQIVDNEW